MGDRAHVDDHAGGTLNHAWYEGAIQAHRRQEIDVEYVLPVLVGQNLEATGFGCRSAYIVDEDVDPAPLPLNASNDRLDSRSCAYIRLDEQRGIGPFRRRATRCGR